ncbi:MAG: MerR family transcriptional regulator [Armatimonadota bacterium]
MPSLEEWNKYLDQQEEALKRSMKPRPDAGNSHDEESIDRWRKKTKPPVPVNQYVMPADPIDISFEETEINKVLRLRKDLPKRILNPQDTDNEVAQNSYKGFKETRDELLNRLLDPHISLEDAARILNVCPTTVRRYTNKGLLKHYRTAGNQRRFRLSDVLAFMNSHAFDQDSAE